MRPNTTRGPKEEELFERYQTVDIVDASLAYRDNSLTPYAAGVEVHLKGGYEDYGLEHQTCWIQLSFADDGTVDDVDIRYRWGDAEFPDRDFIAAAVTALDYDRPDFDAVWKTYQSE